MLAATFELFNFQSGSSGNEFQNQIQQIRTKADAIHAQGEKNVTLDHGIITTELLLNLENRNQQSYQLAFSLIALSIQAHILTPPIFFAFFAQAKRFADNLPTEIACQYPAEIEEIVRALAENAIATGQQKAVVKTLRTLIDRAFPNHHLFSPSYAFFLQVCIKAQMYGVALTFLSQRQIYQITDKTNSQGEEFLKFFYYAGICHISARDYEAALNALVTCITTPSNVLSQIIVQAIKKAKLVSLLYNGEKFFVPKYTSSVVVRAAHDDSQPYDLIVERFLNDDINELGNAIHNNSNKLQEDNNYGLSKQLLIIWKYNKIIKISKSFITLSLNELMESIHYNNNNNNNNIDSFELEKQVFNMIHKDNIVASIHSTEGIIYFNEISLNLKEYYKKKLLLINQLEGDSIDMIYNISNYLRESQKEILSSNDYVQKMTAMGRAGGGGGSNNLWGVASTMEFS